ncbi:unnamed protein product [Caenorhabditis bovis]|uniref:Uncharacterized protein n=1 Tax=Caenorhabditis bovis TaxID=2654633 RepID=A0A8S1F4T9_9PELO|nr:unnamed protein product [Caenorhabditis bovis]
MRYSVINSFLIFLKFKMIAVCILYVLQISILILNVLILCTTKAVKRPSETKQALASTTTAVATPVKSEPKTPEMSRPSTPAPSSDTAGTPIEPPQKTETAKKKKKEEELGVERTQPDEEHENEKLPKTITKTHPKSKAERTLKDVNEVSAVSNVAGETSANNDFDDYLNSLGAPSKTAL